ncbi:MAG: GNAT family N-acetyltransferase [Treponema sp.]|jgi:GNAT superfamily N-acetyltransferase|nr:GNAT family N-acetyltransferase [Treponema sp.]
MQFKLTKSLMSDILFSIENQDGKFLLDTYKGIVVTACAEDADNEGNDEPLKEGRFISLPEWGPADGFRLMERFVLGLHTPAVRKELSAALDQGRGVFRAFKDTLARRPETQTLWFAFKDREMKRKIIAWYNALRTSWGLELAGEEPEDIAGLALEDFLFRDGSAADGEAAAELHQRCLEAYINENTDDQKAIAETLAGMNQWVFPGDLCLVAETAGGEFAACIASVHTSPGHLHICVLEVQPEYRGLGLGKTLLARMLEKSGGQNISRVSIDLPAGTEYFMRVLARESFKPYVQRFCFTR